jgi:hypothetical protein
MHIAENKYLLNFFQKFGRITSIVLCLFKSTLSSFSVSFALFLSENRLFLSKKFQRDGGDGLT